MDFAWTEEQLKFKQAAVEFARKELSAGLVERDRQAEFPREHWRKCAEFGVLGLAVPEAYGGSGADLLTAMLIMEGLGYGCADNGLIFAMNAQMWSVQHPILAFGNEAQKQQYLPGLCSGELIGAHGMSEPDSGSDAYSLRTRAQRADGGYVLTGAKTFVTNAPVADLAVVFATVDPAKTPGWGRRARAAPSSTARWNGSAPASWAATWAPWNASWSSASAMPANGASSASPSASSSRWPTAWPR
jgi:alkylation response protein AidB-like acyl-CoA dehydrogenase